MAWGLVLLAGPWLRGGGGEFRRMFECSQGSPSKLLIFLAGGSVKAYEPETGKL